MMLQPKHPKIGTQMQKGVLNSNVLTKFSEFEILSRFDDVIKEVQKRHVFEEHHQHTFITWLFGVASSSYLIHMSLGTIAIQSLTGCLGNSVTMVTRTHPHNLVVWSPLKVIFGRGANINLSYEWLLRRPCCHSNRNIHS